MPPTRTHPTFDPTVVGAIKRFRRVIYVCMAAAAVVSLIYSFVTDGTQTATAGVVIAPLPAAISANTTGRSSQSATAYLALQLPLLQSRAVTNRAAAIVDEKIPTANLTGQDLNNAVSVTVTTSSKTATGSTGFLTDVNVTLSNGTEAMAAANAILAAYQQILRAQITSQAQQSVGSIQSEISSAQNQLNGLPTSSSSSSSAPKTTTTKAPPTPHVTTTRPAPAPHATTTRAPRTTTTKAPRTTTTKAPKTTTTTSATTTSKHKTLPSGVYQATGPDGSSYEWQLAASTSATTAASGSSSTTSPGTAAQHQALVGLIGSLTSSMTQVKIAEQTDLAYRPTTFPASAQTTVSDGRYWQNLLVGVIVGFIVGAIVAYVLASMRRRFEHETDPELLYDAPRLATVTTFSAPVRSSVALPVVTGPRSEEAESYRAIATSMRALRGDADSLVVAFTAADGGSGTTTTLANTALALSEMGERVLAIDADPFARSLTKALIPETVMKSAGMAEEIPGLSEVLTGRDLRDAVHPVADHESLLVMSSGLDSDMAVRRWRPKALRSVLENAAESFDMVLVDCPAAGASSYGLDVSGVAQHVILVVPHHDAVELHLPLPERLALAGAQPLGYIYNGAPSTLRVAPYLPVLAANGVGRRGEVPLSASGGARGGRAGLAAPGSATTQGEPAGTTAEGGNGAHTDDEDDTTLTVPAVGGEARADAEDEPAD